QGTTRTAYVNLLGSAIGRDEDADGCPPSLLAVPMPHAVSACQGPRHIHRLHPSEGLEDGVKVLDAKDIELLVVYRPMLHSQLRQISRQTEHVLRTVLLREPMHDLIQV